MTLTSDPPKEFDLAAWRARIPVLADEALRQSGSGSSPRGFVAATVVRTLASRSGDLGPSTPCDVYILSPGEPSRRDVTKVGGLPYRPAGVPWPIGESGQPMVFLCQYRFRESQDIVPRVPDDIMLVFCDGKMPDQSNQRSLFFEWHPLGVQRLADRSELPPPRPVHPAYIEAQEESRRRRPNDNREIQRYAKPFPIWHGYRFRTVDYSNAAQAIPLFRGLEWEKAGESGQMIDWGVEALRILSGMKIGGLPSWVDPDDPTIPDGMMFLCSFDDINFDSSDGPFPRHLAASAAEPQIGMDDWLIFFDGSAINFFLDDTGRVIWHMQVGC
jgi:hypothetical protein